MFKLKINYIYIVCFNFFFKLYLVCFNSSYSFVFKFPCKLFIPSARPSSPASASVFSQAVASVFFSRACFVLPGSSCKCSRLALGKRPSRRLNLIRVSCGLAASGCARSLSLRRRALGVATSRVVHSWVGGVVFWTLAPALPPWRFSRPTRPQVCSNRTILPASIFGAPVTVFPVPWSGASLIFEGKATGRGAAFLCAWGKKRFACYMFSLAPLLAGGTKTPIVLPTRTMGHAGGRVLRRLSSRSSLSAQLVSCPFGCPPLSLWTQGAGPGWTFASALHEISIVLSACISSFLPSNTFLAPTCRVQVFLRRWSLHPPNCFSAPLLVPESRWSFSAFSARIALSFQIQHSFGWLLYARALNI